VEHFRVLESFPDREAFYKYLTPNELQDFDTYYEESLFGLLLISRDFEILSNTSKILEFGSGIGLIANHLASLGFDVTNLEPAGQGFGMMSRLQKVVELYYSNNLQTASSYSLKIENYVSNSKFDYIFVTQTF
jgi:2-polyprenyl-3-methyl-5-hydroxy-6-metoxy-1,4-benzoquinol methylase